MKYKKNHMKYKAISCKITNLEHVKYYFNNFVYSLIYYSVVKL